MSEKPPIFVNEKKPAPEMIEGKEAQERFREAMKAIAKAGKDTKENAD